MGDQELTFRLEKPSTDREDLLLVHFEGNGIQGRKFAAGIMAKLIVPSNIEYILQTDNKERGQVDKEPETVDYHQKGTADSSVSVWAINKQDGRITRDQIEEIEFEAQKAVELGALYAQADVIAHRHRR